MPSFFENLDISNWSLETEIWGNTVGQYFLFACVFVGVFALGYIALFGLRAYMKSQQKKADSSSKELGRFHECFSKFFVKTRWFFFGALALICAFSFLTLPARADSFIQGFLLTLIFLQFWLWGSVLAEVAIIRMYEKTDAEATDDSAAKATLPALIITAKTVLFGFVLLLALDNFGIDVTALVAGLGIGGIAIALAAQNIFSDLFASISIILDKPFRVGDFIIVGDFPGTVEKIGLKTTRVKSLGGEQLIFSNSDLLNSRIKNYKRMQERRIVFNFGVLYQTPADSLEKIPGVVKEIIQSDKMCRFDRAHFFKFGDSSYDFEAVYFILSPDYTTYMDAQQRINIAMVKRFEEMGVEFAYPTRTLYVEDVDIKSPALKKIVNA